MESKKINNQSQLIVYILIILGFIGVFNYLSTMFFKRIDLTEKKVYSVSKATKSTLKKIDDIVTVRVCFSKNLPPHLKTLMGDVKDMLSEFKAYAGRNLRISFEDPSASEEKKKQITALGVPEIQMQTYEKDKAQVINGFMGIVVQYADKKEVMPVVQNLTNLEYDLTQAILKVSRKTTPKIAVLKTDTLPVIPPQYKARMKDSPEDFKDKYKPIFSNLEKNYTVENPEMKKGEPISSDIKTLIIPGGEQFTNRDLFEIDQYFMKGGNLIVLTEPIAVSFTYGPMARPQDPGILRLLESYGVRVEHNLVLDASCGQVQIPQQVGPFQMNVAVNYPYFVKIISEDLNKNIPAVSSLSEMVLPWTSSLSLLVPNRDSVTKISSKSVAADSGVKGSALIKSSKKSWSAAGNFDLNPQQKWAPSAEGFKQSCLMAYLTGNFKSYFAGKQVPLVNEADSTKIDSLSKTPAAMADKNREIVTGNKNRHLVVTANASFLTSQFGGIPGNAVWLQNIVDWLSSDDNLISIRTRTMVDRSIRKDELKEGSTSATLVRIFNLGLMPLGVVVIGLFIFFRRRETVISTSSAEKPEEKKS
jgi:gliding-associated putative ABC transporter substrate-binding component GldG